MAGCNRCRRVSSVWRVYVFNVLLMGLAAWSEVIKCYSRLSDSCRIHRIRFLTTFPPAPVGRGAGIPSPLVTLATTVASRLGAGHIFIWQFYRESWGTTLPSPKPLSRPSGQLITHRGIPVPHRQPLNHPGKNSTLNKWDVFTVKGRLLISVTLLGSLITHKIHRVYSGLK